MIVYQDKTGTWFAKVSCHGVAVGETREKAEKLALERLTEAFEEIRRTEEVSNINEK